MQAVTREELAEIIGEKTLHETDRARLVQAVAAYLADVHRAVDIDSLMRDVMQYRQDRGIIEATAVSAHEVTAGVMQDIEDLLRRHFPDAKRIIVSSRLDSSVIGGIKLELPRETLDLSVRSKLNTFKRLVAEENK